MARLSLAFSRLYLLRACAIRAGWLCERVACASNDNAVFVLFARFLSASALVAMLCVCLSPRAVHFVGCVCLSY